MKFAELRDQVRATLKSTDTEGPFELYVTRTPGYLWALFFRRLHIHPIAVTLLSIVIGAVAGFLFGYDSLKVNLIGMLLLIWANWFDCADGQLARMTDQKTLLGRILDGFAGDVWFFSIYFFICLRLHETWGLWIWIIAAIAGFSCHTKQCALADYYRNIHMFFQLGQSKSELDKFAEQRELMYSLPWNKKEWFHKIYLYFYGNYTRNQEKMTPKFQRFFNVIHIKYGNSIPAEMRERFRFLSLPLMKYTNILTFDTRIGVLFLSLIIGMPWLYFVFEIVVLESLRYYVRHVHESFCAMLTKELLQNE